MPAISMKTLATTFLLLATAVSAFAKPIKARITRTDGKTAPYFITGTSATTLMVSPNQSGSGAAPMRRSQVKSVIWEEPDEWKAAWRQWTARDYAAAAASFEALSKEYAGFTTWEDSYGSRALFYHLECLRRLGMWQQVDAKLPEVKAVSLGPEFKQQVGLFTLWGHAGKKMWKPLLLLSNDYSHIEIPEYTVRPQTTSLKRAHATHLAQIGFLRGMAREYLAREQDKKIEAALQAEEEFEANPDYTLDGAITDYARAFTVNFGVEMKLAEQAMRRTMVILVEQMSKLDKEDPHTALPHYLKHKEGHSIADIYKEVYGNGAVPKGTDVLLEKPVKPEGAEDEDFEP